MCVPPHGGRNVNQNAAALLFKHLRPDRYYAFGGLHYVEPYDFAAQADTLIAAGCDGVKMIEGRPSVRRRTRFALDDPVYADFFSLLEKTGTPLLLHVGDPLEYWDAENLPEVARERGWFYGDGEHPAMEELYAETERVLGAHPKLKVILAHFHFMSDDVERAAAFLERHPSACFDLTPGRMFGDFKKAPDEWSEFFRRFADRILFGTDNAGGTRAPNPEKVAHSAGKIRWMREFLEWPNEAQRPGFGLDDAVLRQVYSANFRRMAGDSPKPVDTALAVKECDRAISLAAGEPDEKAVRDELLEIRERF